MTIPVQGVNELVVEVRDLVEAERFYTEVLGFPVIGRWTGDREAVWVLAGTTRIGLWRPQIGISRGRGGMHVHYAMRVAEDDYADVVRKLREQGAKVDEVTFGTDAEVKARSAYVEDPDGHIVEFWTWDVTQGSPGAPTAVTPGVYGL